MPGIQEYRQKVNTPEQTSLSCFGARYAVYLDRGTSVGEAGLSIWLSVDPLSDKYPSLSAYNYCALNPVMLVDPDGRALGDPPISKNSGGFYAKAYSTNSPHLGHYAKSGEFYAKAYTITPGGMHAAFNGGNPYAPTASDNAAAQSSFVDFVPGFETVRDFAGLIVSLGNGDSKEAALYGAALVLPGISGPMIRLAVRNVDDLIDAVKLGGRLNNSKSGKIGDVRGNINEVFDSITKGGKKKAEDLYEMPDGSTIRKYISSDKSDNLPTIQINKRDGSKPIKIRFHED